MTGKTVLITGASRGIGAATARELAARGARLSLVGLEPDALAALADELRGEHVALPADVTDHASVEEAVQRTVEVLGGIDIVMANAGVTNLGSVRMADPEAFARTVDVNLNGVYRTLAGSLPHLLASNGYFLAVGSVASLAPLPGGGAYAASKAGVDALIRTASIELTNSGVDMGIAYPSWIDTEMVRSVEDALPTFRKLRRELPWPLKTTRSPSSCARALADGMERRAQRIYFPRSVGLVAASRAFISSAAGERLISKRAGVYVPQLDADLVASDDLSTEPLGEAGAGP